MYNEVASRLSAELLAALARSARTSTPDQNDPSPVSVTLKNVSSTPALPSPKSWELFLAEVVSNLTSIRRLTPRTKITPTTPTERSTNHLGLVTSTTVPTASAPSSSKDVAKLQQQLRPYHHHRHQQSRVGVGRHTRPGLPLNLKSPPGVMIKNLQLSTDTPPSISWRATTRLPPLTTPPAYLHHVHPPVTPAAGYIHHQQHHQHHHHHHHSHQRIIKKPPAISFLHRNSTNNSTRTLWSKPASQISAASLFRTLGLLTGNDVNVTSSSVTVADMMRYVLSQATRFYGAGKSSY